ncbi:MAG: hypothetical protein ACTHMD_06035 [Flavisolibacter sp.]
MHYIFSPAILTSPSVSCSKCNWQGKGKDITLEELFLTDAIELYCPSCSGYLGFISEPYKINSES